MRSYQQWPLVMATPIKRVDLSTFSGLASTSLGVPKRDTPLHQAFMHRKTEQFQLQPTAATNGKFIIELY